MTPSHGPFPATVQRHGAGARPAGRVLAVLLALVAVAAALRLTGLDKLQPHLQEADWHVVEQVQLIRAGKTDPEQLPISYYQYPTMLARVLALLPERDAPDLTRAGALDASLDTAAADLLLVRTAVALCSILFVPLVWLLARRFVGSGPALVAAGLVVFSALHLLFSQQARMHAVHATFALASVLVALRLRERPTGAAYAAGALFTGLAVGSLHSGGAAALPLVAAHLLRRERRLVHWLWAALAVVPSVLAFVLFYPRPPTVEGEVLEFGGHTLPMARLDGSGFRLVAQYLWDYEPGLSLAALLGLLIGLVALARGRRVQEPGERAGVSGQRGERLGDLLVVLAYALPYLAAVGVMGLTQDRFLIPLLPFLACLAAWPVALMRPRPALALGLAVVVLAFPTWVVANYVSVRVHPDTVEQAAAWVRENVRPLESEAPERVLTTARLALPLFHSPEALRVAKQDYATRKTMWLGWQLRHLPREDGAEFGGERWHLLTTPGKLLNTNKDRGQADVDDWLARADADWAVVEVSKLMAFIPAAELLRKTIAERGELVTTIRGEDPRWCTVRPLDYQEVPAFVSRILAATAFGPCIEIYRLDR